MIILSVILFLVSVIYLFLLIILRRKFYPKMKFNYRGILFISLNLLFFLAIFSFSHFYSRGFHYNLLGLDKNFKENKQEPVYHRAEIILPFKKIKAVRGNKLLVKVKLKNKSNYIWDSKLKGTFYSYHLLDANKNMIQYENFWTPFAEEVKIGETVDGSLTVDVPKKKGIYYLQVDLVQKRVTWFSKNLSPSEYALIKLEVI